MKLQLSHGIWIAFVAVTCLGHAAKAEMIHLMARKGDVPEINRLLSEGVPVDLPSTRNTSLLGVSPLYVAAQFGRLEAVAALLAAGADPTFRSTDPLTDGTPIHLAARVGSTQIVTLLLDHGVDPNLYDKWLGTPLHQARLNGHTELEALLIARGANINWRAASISDKLSAADVSAGRAIIKGCATFCHSIETDETERSLRNIVGAAKAARPGYEYSSVLKSIGGNWTVSELNNFIASPSRYAPGSGMSYSLPDDDARADAIAYLLTLSD